MLACTAKVSTPARQRRLAMLGEVPYITGAFDLPASRTRPRDRGIDRDITVYWSTQPITWRKVAAHPLVRALEAIRLAGSPRRHREESLAAFIRAAPALKLVENIGEAGAAIVKVVGWKLRGDDRVR